MEYGPLVILEIVAIVRRCWDDLFTFGHSETHVVVTITHLEVRSFIYFYGPEISQILVE